MKCDPSSPRSCFGRWERSRSPWWFTGAFGALERRGPPKGDPFPRLIEMVEDDLRRAYEQGGPEQLATHLRRLDRYLPGEHLLTDECGRDLASGADRSELLTRGHGPPGPRHLPDGRMIFVGPPRTGAIGSSRSCVRGSIGPTFSLTTARSCS